MNAIIYHGDKKQREELRRKHMPRTIGPKFPIIVTSYEVALTDSKKYLRHYSWKYLVIDEVSDPTNLSAGLLLPFLTYIFLLKGTQVEKLKMPIAEAIEILTSRK